MNNEYNCYKCNKIFKKKYNLEQHYKRKTDCSIKKNSLCDICLHDFKTIQKLERHKNKKYPCKPPDLKLLNETIVSLKNENQILQLNTNIATTNNNNNVNNSNSNSCNNTINGIIYLIQPEELIGTNRYKIGISSKNNISRINSYKKNTIIIYVLECYDPLNLEKIIKNKFKNVFKLVAGNEYFECSDLYLMKTNFLNLYMDYINKQNLK